MLVGVSDQGRGVVGSVPEMVQHRGFLQRCGALMGGVNGAPGGADPLVDADFPVP